MEETPIVQVGLGFKKLIDAYIISYTFTGLPVALHFVPTSSECLALCQHSPFLAFSYHACRPCSLSSGQPLRSLWFPGFVCRDRQMSPKRNPPPRRNLPPKRKGEKVFPRCGHV